jgi:hypothetical protein
VKTCLTAWLLLLLQISGMFETSQNWLLLKQKTSHEQCRWEGF